MLDINIVIANNQHDPMFIDMAKRLRDGYRVTHYLGDDHEEYDYTNEVALFNDEYFGLFKSGDIYRLTEWDPGSASNDFFIG